MILSVMMLFGLFANAQIIGEPMDLSKAQIEGGTWDGKALSCTGNRARLYLPVESYKDAVGIYFMLDSMEKLGDVYNNNLCSVCVTFADEWGDEQTNVWQQYRTGKKKIRFNNWGKDGIDIKPESIKKIWIEIGHNKKVAFSTALMTKK